MKYFYQDISISGRINSILLNIDWKKQKWNKGIDFVVATLYSKYKMNKMHIFQKDGFVYDLKPAEITRQASPTEQFVYDTTTVKFEGYNLKLAIPFYFDQSLLTIKPSTQIITYYQKPSQIIPRSGNDTGLIIFSFEISNDEMENLKKEFKNSLKHNVYKKYISKTNDFFSMCNNLEDTLANWNRTLKARLLEKAKSELNKHNQHQETMKLFDVKSTPTNWKIQIPIKTNLVINVTTSKEKSSKKRFVPKEYIKNINYFINKHLESILPLEGLWKQFDENSYRDTIIAALTTNAVNAGSEIKHGKGKTDISIINDGHLDYCAELKLWSGISKIEATIAQVMSYATSYDKYLNLYIINNKVNNIEEVRKRLNNFLKDKYQIINVNKGHWTISTKNKANKSIKIEVFLHHFISMS